jgi:hypothetical protein
MPSRRGFITGLIAFTASAPAIVKAESLMPVKRYVRSGLKPITVVDVANQIGNSITITPSSLALVPGDIVTIDGVEAINRVTRQPTGSLRLFVITAAVAKGHRILHLYPSIHAYPVATHKR